MKSTNLLEAPANREIKVLEINAGQMAKKRLISMGIHVEDKLMKYSNSSWGPVLIRNVTLNSTKIGIGKRLASKIIVSYEET